MKVGTGGKWRKNLRSSKSAALSIKNLKRFAVSAISLEVKLQKKKRKRAYTTETEWHKHNNN